MRKTFVQWFNRFDLPEHGRAVWFDFGLGEVAGNFHAGRFITGDCSSSWDRILVNKWRYHDQEDATAAAA